METKDQFIESRNGCAISRSADPDDKFTVCTERVPKRLIQDGVPTIEEARAIADRTQDLDK